MGDFSDGAGDSVVDSVVPDTKDWTWTLERACPECGFEASAVPGPEVATRALTLTAPWDLVLARADVRERPEPAVWSPLEYACHVRDVCRVFEDRVRLMLEQDDPQFANWNQDETALAEQYGTQDPATVGAELRVAAARTSTAFGTVGEEQWGRRGRRSNGTAFTVLTLGQYFLHDLAHHLFDVRA
ncbi:MAG TPA: DinB family protein [Pedococcus sp.]|nr:DinB family protein [Pedococcus sp.]